MQSFLLIGQSNMAGRGVLSEAKPIDTSHIFVLRNGRFLNMFRPVHPDRSFSGVCLAESFADAYAKKHGTDVGLIPCADGGTRLEQWQKGTVLYDNAVYQTRLAMRSSTVVGILWHQGEGDCEQTLASTYKERFTKMITDLKKDLGLEQVPVIVGGLGDFLSENSGNILLHNYKTVNEQLQSIAYEDALTGFASAEGLTDKGDKLHFNTDSLYELGLRYFNEFEKLNKNSIEEKQVDLTLTEMEKL